MKAIIIRGQEQQLEVTELGREDDIKALIGQDSVIFDEIDDANVVYFDEDCFIRGTEGRFQIDSLAPIAGVGVVIGRRDNNLTDTSFEEDALLGRTKFL
ncbi:MAG: hypothetical protein QNI86_11355 [Halieaceae bacterium]|nr:hypothetical protein [Halieaceae bacterium]